jgi:hypothetical protein
MNEGSRVQLGLGYLLYMARRGKRLWGDTQDRLRRICVELSAVRMSREPFPCRRPMTQRNFDFAGGFERWNKERLLARKGSLFGQMQRVWNSSNESQSDINSARTEHTRHA